MPVLLPALRCQLTAVFTWIDLLSGQQKLRAALSGAALIVFVVAGSDTLAETAKVWQMPMPGVQQIKIDAAGRPIVVDGAGGHHRLRMSGGQLVIDPAQPDERPTLPKNALPDAEIATSMNGLTAWLSDPTTRYAHAVLGDDIEAGSLSVRYSDGSVKKLVLHEDEVFEDRYPRFYDINGDDRDEILVVRSSQFGGAALVVVDPGSADGDGSEIIAAADEIGLANRWLNPLGAADVDGDGRTELLVVVMPHLLGLLGVYEMKDTTLVPEQGQPGFSNHGYGSYELALSALADMDGDGISDAILPDARRRELRVVRFTRGAPEVIARYPAGGSIEHRVLTYDLDGDGALEVITATSKDHIVVWKPTL